MTTPKEVLVQSLKPFALMVFVLCSVTSPTAAQDSECVDIQSHACRTKAAGLVQTSFNERFPQMRIRADGDVIVFADPSIFGRQEDRASFLRQSAPTLQNEICQFGFKKMRIESATKATPLDEYAFSCGMSAQRTQAEAGARTSAIPASPETISQAAHSNVANDGEKSPTRSSDSRQSEAQLGAGVITGKLFLITRNGDLKAARLASVFLLDAHAGGKGGKDSAALFYWTTMTEHLKASYRKLADPDDSISCSANLSVFLETLKNTLEWNEKNKKGQIKIGTADEEGAFHFSGVLAGEYLILAQGHAGANRAYWEEEATAETGIEVSIKLSSPKKACLDF